jgi:hypothetical protein
MKHQLNEVDHKPPLGAQQYEQSAKTGRSI